MYASEWIQEDATNLAITDAWCVLGLSPIQILHMWVISMNVIMQEFPYCSPTHCLNNVGIIGAQSLWDIELVKKEPTSLGPRVNHEGYSHPRFLELQIQGIGTK